MSARSPNGRRAIEGEELSVRQDQTRCKWILGWVAEGLPAAIAHDPVFALVAGYVIRPSTTSGSFVIVIFVCVSRHCGLDTPWK
jgi:hypothetical protein